MRVYVVLREEYSECYEGEPEKYVYVEKVFSDEAVAKKYVSDINRRKGYYYNWYPAEVE